MVGFPLATAPTKNTIGLELSNYLTKLNMSISFPFVESASFIL
jgi:hypothetical protein